MILLPIEQYIVRLEVPVRKSQVVQRPQRVRSLGDVEGRVSLGQWASAARQKARQVTARAQLHY